MHFHMEFFWISCFMMGKISSVWTSQVVRSKKILVQIVFTSECFSW